MVHGGEPGRLADILAIEADPPADLDDSANTGLATQDSGILIDNLG